MPFQTYLRPRLARPQRATGMRRVEFSLPVAGRPKRKAAGRERLIRQAINDAAENGSETFSGAGIEFQLHRSGSSILPVYTWIFRLD